MPQPCLLKTPIKGTFSNNNSGDFLSRENYVCGGPNPGHLSKGGIKHRFGSMLSQCDGSGVESASTNVKFKPSHYNFVMKLRFVEEMGDVDKFFLASKFKLKKNSTNFRKRI